ncbi:MAG: CinA family protein [Salaquimonas sp.]|jgi:nicotinamide-nucleotide amidase|nr:CinA family protein [Salaquimonas sp.]
MKVDENLGALAESVLDTCRIRGMKLATAESCTGGLIAALLTSIAGSSDVFDRGFVTYSNEAKTEMIGVTADLIERNGAVSSQVARAMAEGAVRYSQADLAVSVTGIAGPGGGSTQKPVGLVHIAGARRSDALVRQEEHRFGDLGRDAVRGETARMALRLLLTLCEK